jgi:hypothetical protein
MWTCKYKDKKSDNEVRLFKKAKIMFGIEFDYSMITCIETLKL